MKKLILFTMCLFLISTVSAEIYLTYDSNSNEIKDLSKRKDVVLQESWKRIELPGEPFDYNSQIQYHPSYYFYKDGKFVLNIKKISDETLKEEKAQEKAEEMKLIEKQMKLNALKELKAKGQSFRHIKEKDFE